MNFNFIGFAFDMAMFGSGLGIGAFVALNWKPQTRVIPPELMPVDVACQPEPRVRGTQQPPFVSPFAPKKVRVVPKPQPFPLHPFPRPRVTKWPTSPALEAVTPPPAVQLPPERVRVVAASGLLPVNEWKPGQ